MADKNPEYKVSATWQTTGPHCDVLALIQPPIAERDQRAQVIAKSQALARKAFNSRVEVTNPSDSNYTVLMLRGVHRNCNRTHEDSHSRLAAQGGGAAVLQAMTELGFKVKGDVSVTGR